MLEKAILIAINAHQGQTDKAGESYILHPLRVMFSRKNETERICAVLHDVIEDTDVTLDYLRDEGFSEEVLSSLDALTKRNDEDYNEFIDRVIRNNIACHVKLADLCDNMDLSRIKNPTKKDYQRIEKYRKAANKILNALEYESNSQLYDARKMKFVVNSDEMKRADFNTINKIGIPSMVLMERAALSVVEELFGGGFNLRKVVVACGSGNNGGDGIAIARLLYLKGIDVKILFLGDESKCTNETKQQMEIARKYGIQINENENFEGCTTIIDAIFGIGISRFIEGNLASLINVMNNSGVDILAVDMPSGISTDTGEVMGIAVRAKMTVTFAYRKLGLVLPPGVEYAGVVKVKNIGITELSL